MSTLNNWGSRNYLLKCVIIRLNVQSTIILRMQAFVDRFLNASQSSQNSSLNLDSVSSNMYIFATLLWILVRLTIYRKVSSLDRLVCKWSRLNKVACRHLTLPNGTVCEDSPIDDRIETYFKKYKWNFYSA